MKKLKNYFIAFTMLHVATHGGAQLSLAQTNLDDEYTSVLAEYQHTVGDFSSLYQGRIEPTFLTNLWIGHPYWDDDKFYMGDVCFDGRLYKNVRMRYNIYDNILAVLTHDKELPVVPDRQKINHIVINGKRYVEREGWLECVEYEGKDVSLTHRRVKLRSIDVIKDKISYHTLNTIDTYYLIYADGRCEQVSNLRSVRKANKDLSKELKKMSHEQRLSFSGNSLVPSLVACASFLDEKIDLNIPQEQKTLSAYDMTRPQPALEKDVLSAVHVNDSIPAFYAYSPGGKADYSLLEEDYVDDNPGIGTLTPLKETHTLREVQVVGFRQKVVDGLSGVEAFRPEMLRNVPLALGEADVMKMAMMLPGVSSMGEASDGLNVRGGSSDQNLLLYNNNTVYNPMHMFGLFSTFNSDMISETELYKGGIPAQYGGRLSSVMTIKSKTGSKDRWHGSASVGLLTAKAFVEAPLVKDKVSLIVGGRATYSDWMLKLIPEKSGYKDGKAGFWDMGATLSSKLCDNHNLLVHGYYSHDRFSFSPDDKYAYSNLNLSAEWKGSYGENATSSVSVGYDRYGYQNDDTKYAFYEARLSFHLSDYFLKSRLSYKLGENNTLSAGLQSQYYDVMPGEYSPLPQKHDDLFIYASSSSYYDPNEEYTLIQHTKLDKNNALESALFAEDVWDLTDKLKLTAGVRVNVFNSFKKDMKKMYVNPDVRLAANYALTDNMSVKVGFNTLHQYIHKVSNTVIMSPTDTWTLSSSAIKPQSGYQISGGWYAQTEDRKYEFSIEAYYKGISNYLTYRSAAQLVMNNQLEKDVTTAKGKAYGVELQLRKLYGKLNGWISYCYSRTLLKHNDPNMTMLINGGEWYAADHDRPHEVKFVGNYKFSERFSVSLNADYSTGRPFTAPIGKFYDTSSGNILPYYSDRNALRMPDYFRMDCSLNIEPSHHLTNLFKSWFSIGVYNMLGRKNVYSIYFDADAAGISGHKLSIFGAPIPFVSYNIKF